MCLCVRGGARSEDVRYIESLTRHLLATYPEVSRDAVYAWGYSNGAFLTLVRTKPTPPSCPRSLAVRVKCGQRAFECPAEVYERRQGEHTPVCTCFRPSCVQKLPGVRQTRAK